MRVWTRSRATGDWVQRELVQDAWMADQSINERGTATIAINDPTGVLRFERGQGVWLETRDGMVVFRGFIERPTGQRLAPGGHRRHNLECVDLHYLADKRRVLGAWTHTPIGQIVRDIITDILSAEGITPGDIHDGPTLRAFTTNYQSAGLVISDLATRAGYWWHINADFSLDFGPPNATEATPTRFDSTIVTMDSTITTFDEQSSPTLTPDLALADSISITGTGAHYRNQQWIRGGRDRTDIQIEEFAGDGVRRSFTVGFPVAIEPTVEVDRGGGWQAETVGVAGLQEGRQWTWANQSHTLTQNTGEPILSPTDRLRVTYTGEFNIVAMTALHTEIQARQLIEGGSGIVEHVLDDRLITGREEAFERASSLLSVYGADARLIRFRTRSRAFKAGLLAHVDLPEAGLTNTTALVQGVDWHSQQGELRATVTLVSGPSDGTWAQFFARLIGRIDSATAERAAEVDIITIPLTFEKDWLQNERPNIFFEAFPGAGVFPGALLVPSFERHERVLFMGWLKDGVEHGRKLPTQQTGLETDEITTVVVLGAPEAVGSWDALAWFGGPTATMQVGTGTELARIPITLDKTDVEQIQVTRIDRKGW